MERNEEILNIINYIEFKAETRGWENAYYYATQIFDNELVEIAWKQINS